MYWQILPELQTLFRQNGLGDFEALMRAPVGEFLSRDAAGRELRRITLGSGQEESRFYLKRIGAEPLRLVLRLLLFAHRPRSGALREKLLLDRLRGEGFAAMAPVAWGERRVFGLPREGFLMVREVPGLEVAVLHEKLEGGRRLELMTEVGKLVGRLHGKGFFQPVRLKDLIKAESASSNDALVLIDRETSKPWPGRFTRQRCLASLTRSFRRVLRDGQILGAGSASAFLKGYVAGLGGRWTTPPGDLARQLVQDLRRQMAGRSRLPPGGG